MKICPIAIAVGCPSCPAFKICPAKESLGGYVKEAAKPVAPKRPAKRPSSKAAKPVGKPARGKARK